MKFHRPIALMLAFLIPGFIVAQDNTAPAIKWKMTLAGAIVSSPVVEGDNLFIGTYDSTFYCMSASTGKIRWQYRTGGRVGSTAALSVARVLFYSSDGVLYCLSKDNGKLVWRFKTYSGALPDRRYDWPDYFQSSPAVSEGVVYFGAGDGRVYAVDDDSGQVRWTFQTGDVVHTRPAVDSKRVVVGSFDGNVYCLDKNLGSVLWKFKTTGQRYFPRGEVNGNPVIYKDKVFAGARDYNLYALDLEAGYCHWLKTFPQGWALPVTPNDSVIYVGTSDDRLLLALDPETGFIQWRQNLGFNIFGGMALTEKLGYVGTLMGKVFAVDLATGKVAWTFEGDGFRKNRSRYFKDDENYFVDHIGSLLNNGDAILKMYHDLGAIFSAPVVSGENIVVAANDGTLYCLVR